MKRALLAIAMAVLFACPGRADVVYLKDGKQKEGEIVEQTDEMVKLKIYFASGGSAVLPIPMSKVERIEKKEYVRPKPPEKKTEEPAAKPKKKEEETIPPPPPKKPVLGVRGCSWGIPLERVRYSGDREKLRIPGYFDYIDAPEEIKARVPEGYIPPRDAGFSNVIFYRYYGGYANHKMVYMAFKGKVYCVRGNVPLEEEGYEKTFKDWVEECRKEMGGETERLEDGTMIWDSPEGYAKFTPNFNRDDPPTPSTIVMSYKIMAYGKELRKQVLEWAEKNLPEAKPEEEESKKEKSEK